MMYSPDALVDGFKGIVGPIPSNTLNSTRLVVHDIACKHNFEKYVKENNGNVEINCNEVEMFENKFKELKRLFIEQKLRERLTKALLVCKEQEARMMEPIGIEIPSISKSENDHLKESLRELKNKCGMLEKSIESTANTVITSMNEYEVKRKALEKALEEHVDQTRGFFTKEKYETELELQVEKIQELNDQTTTLEQSVNDLRNQVQSMSDNVESMRKGIEKSEQKSNMNVTTPKKKK